MKTAFLYLVGFVAIWAVATTLEYVGARILAPGFGLSVPNFEAFGWVTFFVLIVSTTVGLIKGLLEL